MRTFKFRGSASALALAAVTLGVFGFATPAGASSRAINIVSAVNLRPAPNAGGASLGLMPAGARPRYICYADGQNVGGTTKWFNVEWSGKTGYYSSIADDVPLGAQRNLEGSYSIPRCGTGTDINQGGSSGVTVNPAPTVYNRAAAVTWATQNAQAVRANRFADCTWFVSQALWYGGFHQTNIWNSHDNHGFPLWPVPGTVAATAAPNLVDYLVAHESVTVTQLTADRFMRNAVPEAQPGDLIAYDWDTKEGDEHRNGSGIDHLAFVVGIAPGNYPEVAEWGTSWPRVPYAKRGWTWSEGSHQWLQQKLPYVSRENTGVSAVLIHFNY